MRRYLQWLCVAFALAFSATTATAQKSVTIGYADMMNPFRWVQESGELEKATGYRIKWRQFGGGGDIIRGMASGDVQISELGSAGVATAVSQGMDIQLFWILEDIALAEAFVARNGKGINSIADLKGKKVATPFVSTAHFQLIYALDKAGLKTGDVEVLNLRAPDVAAAWERGDIDATFIWEPVLSAVKKHGKVLATSADVCKQGACTFDGLVVTSKFAKEHPQFMVALVKAIARADADYRANPQGWSGNSAKAKAVAKWSKGKLEDVPDVMKLYGFPTLAEQASPAWLGGGKNGVAVKAITQQAQFLKEQGRITALLPDYSKAVTTEWVTRAMK